MQKLDFHIPIKFREDTISSHLDIICISNSAKITVIFLAVDRFLITTLERVVKSGE